jgi:hypothetical protein
MSVCFAAGAAIAVREIASDVAGTENVRLEILRYQALFDLFMLCWLDSTFCLVKSAPVNNQQNSDKEMKTRLPLSYSSSLAFGLSLESRGVQLAI